MGQVPSKHIPLVHSGSSRYLHIVTGQNERLCATGSQERRIMEDEEEEELKRARAEAMRLE